MWLLGKVDRGYCKHWISQLLGTGLGCWRRVSSLKTLPSFLLSLQGV